MSKFDEKAKDRNDEVIEDAVSKGAMRDKKGATKARKGRSRNTKNKGKDTNSKGNKRSWNPADMYIPDEGLRKQIGNMSFRNTIGIDTDLTSVVDGASHRNSFGIPSVMAFKFFPSIDDGSRAVGRAAIDIAGNKLFSAVGANTGRALSASTPQDYSLAILDIGNLCGLISHAIRIYGVTFNYNPRNRSVPKALIKALGIDYDDLINHLANYRMRENALMVGANCIRMPKDIKYFQKCWNMYASVFIDAESSMSQYYLFKPAGYFKFYEKDPEGLIDGSYLEFKPFAEQITYDTLLDVIEEKINDILNSTTFNTVFTDILNYMQKQGGDLIGFGYMNELCPIDFVYDRMFLTQIHNMQFYPGNFQAGHYKITQDINNNILTATDPINLEMLINDGGTMFPAMIGDQILDFPFTDTPTADDVIDALAYTTIIDEAVTDVDTPYAREALPDHACCGMEIYKLEGNNITKTEFQYNQVTGAFIENVELATFSFDYLPMFYDIKDGKRTPICDINYYTVVDVNQLANMRYYYYLGLFDTTVKESKQF